MGKKSLLLGIDAGSSSTKLGLFTVDGQIFRECSFITQISHPANNQAELNLNILFDDLIKNIREICEDVADCVKGIGFSVASPTVVLFDKNNESVRPGIAYFDNRAIKEVQEFVEQFGGTNMYFSRVGNNPSPSTCVAATIQWIRTHEPEVWDATEKIGFLNSWFGVKLTGVLACDPTVSSYSGMLRVRKPHQWEQKFMDIYDLSLKKLPPLISCLERLGNLKPDVAHAMGLPAGIPVSIGSADTAASSFAMGVRRHGDVYQSMGTSEVAVFCLNNPNFSPAFMNRAHVIPNLWLSNGAMSMAGGSIKWFINHIAPELNNETEMEHLAMHSKRGANGVIFVPYLCGERSPMFDARAMGMFFGVTSDTKKADLARAVYEGVALAMGQIYRIGASRWEVNPPHIICIGGAAKSPLSLQLRADIENRPIQMVDISNASSFGAALMGGFAANIYSDIWDFPIVENYEKTIQPNPDNVLFYLKYREIYNSLYISLKESMHHLYDYTNDIISDYEEELV